MTTRLFWNPEREEWHGFGTGAMPPGDWLELPEGLTVNHAKDRLVDGVIVPFVQPASLQEAISAEYTALPKPSRKKFRPLITEGFVALQAGNPVSMGDILDEATELAGSAEEVAFLHFVQGRLAEAFPSPE